MHYLLSPDSLPSVAGDGPLGLTVMEESQAARRKQDQGSLVKSQSILTPRQVKMCKARMEHPGPDRGGLYLPARCEVSSEPPLCYNLEGRHQEGQGRGDKSLFHRLME